MGINSTQFISYRDINVEGIDLYEDAFGLYHEFSDVFDILRASNFVPPENLIDRLIVKIRKQGKEIRKY